MLQRVAACFLFQCVKFLDSTLSCREADSTTQGGEDVHIYIYICIKYRPWIHSWWKWRIFSHWCSVLQCVAVCCSMLQRVAACCSVLQRAAVSCRCIHVVVCCSVLQCVAVCCSVWQCVAVCCSVLQRLTDTYML